MERTPSPRSTPAPGLYNLGNTCYLNSVVQVLFYVEEFRAHLRVFERLGRPLMQGSRDKEEESFPVLKELSMLYTEMYEVYAHRAKTKGPSAIRPSGIWAHFREVFGYGQQDAQEFLRYVLTNIEEAVKAVRKARGLPPSTGAAAAPASAPTGEHSPHASDVETDEDEREAVRAGRVKRSGLPRAPPPVDDLDENDAAGRAGRASVEGLASTATSPANAPILPRFIGPASRPGPTFVRASTHEGGSSARERSPTLVSIARTVLPRAAGAARLQRDDEDSDGAAAGSDDTERMPSRKRKRGQEEPERQDDSSSDNLSEEAERARDRVRLAARTKTMTATQWERTPSPNLADIFPAHLANGSPTYSPLGAPSDSPVRYHPTLSKFFTEDPAGRPESPSAAGVGIWEDVTGPLGGKPEKEHSTTRKSSQEAEEEGPLAVPARDRARGPVADAAEEGDSEDDDGDYNPSKSSAEAEASDGDEEEEEEPDDKDDDDEENEEDEDKENTSGKGKTKPRVALAVEDEDDTQTQGPDETVDPVDQTPVAVTVDVIVDHVVQEAEAARDPREHTDDAAARASDAANSEPVSALRSPLPASRLAISKGSPRTLWRQAGTGAGARARSPEVVRMGAAGRMSPARVRAQSPPRAPPSSPRRGSAAPPDDAPAVIRQTIPGLGDGRDESPTVDVGPGRDDASNDGGLVIVPGNGVSGLGKRKGSPLPEEAEREGKRAKTEGGALARGDTTLLPDHTDGDEIPVSQARMIGPPERPRLQNSADSNATIPYDDERMDSFSGYVNDEELIDFVEDTFQGVLVSSIRCLQCQYSSDRREAFMDLSVPVKAGCSLIEAMNQFTKHERLTGSNKYSCPTCHTQTEAEKSFHLARLPPVVTIHLNRFSFDGVKGKVQTHMPAPTRMCFSRWCGRDCADRDAEYELFGLIFHAGYSASSGHYYCYVKPSAGLEEFDHHPTVGTAWFNLDDSDVTRMTEAEVMYLTSPERGRQTDTAYILFYRRTGHTADLTAEQAFSAMEDETVFPRAESVGGMWRQDAYPRTDVAEGPVAESVMQ